MDDNKVIRQLIRVNLELEGFEVVTAADGAEALDIVEQVRPDAVTLDVVMPRLDGLRTAARLRNDPGTRELPLVIVSACTQYEVESGLEVGVDAFLAKPFEPSELVALVRRLVEQGRGSGTTSGATSGAASGAASVSGSGVGSGVGTASGAASISGSGVGSGAGASVDASAAVDSAVVQDKPKERAGRGRR
uniref:response regulator n=1 Tax=Streptomyces polyasparticus TaxID=2767826 RepID=UPI00280BC1DC|nr:response regulator [Streptomyces polyasparticus]